MPRAAPRARRSSPTPRAVFVGVDTGGTFTDFVCRAGRETRVHKRLSTPDDPARAVLEGLGELLRDLAPPGAPRAGAARADLGTVSYGSTVATNAVLERKGARVVLLTTRGFEDLLEIGRQTRPDLYALEPEKPLPLVASRRRIGVAERVEFDGGVLLPLAPAAIDAALARVRGARAESVAICFLHSYANPAHERLLGRALSRLGLPCSLSHQIVAEYREYERLSTTVINAYVSPAMQRHLASLERGIGEARLRVMQSNGGAVSVGTASREAVRTLLSGPAGGVIGARSVARRVGVERIITFDMGGTSTDVSLVDGEVRLQTEWSIAELPVKVPAIDIHTVGAGGGSIARVDAGGVLKVGPESAGADPGPACYGKGNTATVTDANLVLGRLIPEGLLGGRMSLDAARAERVLAQLGAALGTGPVEAAEGVVRVVNAAMERAIRRISVERGHDPRRHVLVAFGGAAGLHACELAAGLGIRRVLLPLHPGLLSAWGAVSADLQRDYVRTVRLTDASRSDLERRLAPLIRRARRDLGAEAGGRARVRAAAYLDLRYRGQSYEIRLPMSAAYRSAFHAAHRRLYGYADQQRPIETVNLRVFAVVRGATPPHARGEEEPGAPRRHRVRWNGRWVASRLYRRGALPRRLEIAGPLVITEMSATTFVPPGWAARVLDTGDLLLESRRRAPGSEP
jgi:N-methylhydantoinase A